MTAHEFYWQHNVFGWGVYQYDPTDDGPECEIITRIFANHPFGSSGDMLYRHFLRDCFGLRKS